MGEPKINPKSRAIRRQWIQLDALCCGMHWDEVDLGKLQILIEDVFGDSHPGSVHLDKLAKEAATGVIEEGGKPAHFHATDICDGWAMLHNGMNYILPSREILCDLVEIHGRVIPWDGIIAISSCDKSIPAHLMALSRLNIPALHVPGGSNRVGPNLSHSILTGETAEKMRRGEDVSREIRDYQLSACPGAGACQFMGTASTMQSMAEALGMSLPGSALIPASLAEIGRMARQAGRALMKLIKKGIRPSDILTKEAFENAMKVHAAIAGSTNALLHLPAIARELGIKIEAERFDQLNREIPYIANIQPSGEYLTELFWYAGGIPRVQMELRDVLDLKVLTVTGKTLKENLDRLEKDGFFRIGEGFLANYKIKREEVIGKVKDSKAFGSIAVLKGNLAPEGAVVKYAAVPPEMMRHEGPAQVFNREEEALQAIIKGRIKPGAVIIIRYEGPRGSGMPEILATTEALVTNPTLRNTAIVTDGRFSGATRGPCIGHVSPEAAQGGSLALVEEGDLILIDIPCRLLAVVGIKGKRLDAADIVDIFAERKKRWKAPLLKHPAGILRRYSQQAASAMEGAYLIS